MVTHLDLSNVTHEQTNLNIFAVSWSKSVQLNVHKIFLSTFNTIYDGTFHIKANITIIFQVIFRIFYEKVF